MSYDKEYHDAKRRDEEIRQARKRANLPTLHINAETIPYSDSSGYRPKLKEWTDGFIAALNTGETYGGLYLWGKSGYGKSFMAASIGRWAVASRITTQYVEFHRMFETKVNPAPWDEVLVPGYTDWDAIQDSKLLIIDDVGRDADTRYGRNNVTTLETVMEGRHSSGLVTIITSQASPDQLHRVISRRFEDLVKEACWTMEINEVNYREYFSKQRGAL